MAILIGIAGGSGSGKTTLAENLAAALPGQVLILPHDAYYRDRSDVPRAQRERLNFDEPAALDNHLYAADLRRLRDGFPIECPEYDFATHTRRGRTLHLEPRPVVIGEGALLFAIPELRDLFLLRVFVDTPEELRLRRRLERDLAERGRDPASIEVQFAASVRPMHDLYVEPTRHCAHVVVPEGGMDREVVHGLARRIAGLQSQPGRLRAAPVP